MSRKRKITVTEVRDALLEVAAQDPTRVDRRATDGLAARYVDRGEPNCLVAVVLTKLGFSEGVLAALDHEPPVGELVRSGIKIHCSRHIALRRIEPAAMALLGYVQDLQDKGERWGRIVDRAFTLDRWFPRRDRQRKTWLAAV